MKYLKLLIVLSFLIVPALADSNPWREWELRHSYLTTLKPEGYLTFDGGRRYVWPDASADKPLIIDLTPQTFGQAWVFNNIHLETSHDPEYYIYVRFGNGLGAYGNGLTAWVTKDGAAQLEKGLRDALGDKILMTHEEALALEIRLRP